VRALFAWCKFRIIFIPVTDLVVVMQINYYYIAKIGTFDQFLSP